MTDAPFSDDHDGRRPAVGPATEPAEPGAGEATFASFKRAEALMSQRRPLDAVQALLPVLAAQPDDASVHLLAGRAFLDSAQLRRAEAAFTRVLEIDPADHYARFALGKALQRQGRLTESLAQLRMASAMDPRPEYQDAIGEVRARIAISDNE
ncbi:MAG: tetratricopeptide repeat protein [Candidatus Dormibacteraeota bacterium]|nr:tetratricopeptide repeat protein [Candidatus Dormibacteraeota bacterium]